MDRYPTFRYWLDNKFGDIKSALLSNDHLGWVLLDGRAKTALSLSQQSVATILGIGNNIPDATNCYLVQGNSLGNLLGSNTKTITRSDLPNVSLSGQTASAGAHTHMVDVTTVSKDGSGGDVYKSGNSNSITTSSDGAHTHTFLTESLNGGVTQTSFNVQPQSIQVNFFIYLGS